MRFFGGATPLPDIQVHLPSISAGQHPHPAWETEYKRGGAGSEMFATVMFACSQSYSTGFTQGCIYIRICIKLSFWIRIHCKLYEGFRICIEKTAGSGSARNECGFTALVSQVLRYNIGSTHYELNTYFLTVCQCHPQNFRSLFKDNLF